MSRIILLDSGPLGLITNPSASEENCECNDWIQSRLRIAFWFPRSQTMKSVESCCGQRKQKDLPDWMDLTDEAWLASDRPAVQPGQNPTYNAQGAIHTP